MAKRREQVGVQAVRAFAEAKGVQTGSRGRVSKALIEEFEKETGKRVVTGFKSEATVTLTKTTMDSKGRKRTRKVEVPVSEARVLAGEAAGERGVLGAKALEAASLALSTPPKS